MNPHNDDAWARLRELLERPKEPSPSSFEPLLRHLIGWPEPDTFALAFAYTREHLEPWGERYANALQLLKWKVLQEPIDQNDWLQESHEIVVDVHAWLADDVLPLEEVGWLAVTTGLATWGEVDLGSWGHLARYIEAAPSPQPLSFGEFLGEGYDLELGDMSLHQYSQGGISTSVFSGFAHALLDPPYSIGIPVEGEFGSERYASSQKRGQKAFLSRYLARVCGIIDLRPSPDTRFFQWPANWADYFAPGMEWWGSFCWSIHTPTPEGHKVITLYASATD